MTYIADGSDSLTLMAGPFDLTGQSVIPGTETCRMEVTEDGFSFGQISAEARARASRLRDGSITEDGPFGNRTATFPVRFSAEDSVDLARGIAAVWRWCSKPDTYTWQHPDGLGVATTFDAQRAWLSGEVDDLEMLRTEESLTLSVECLPFGRSPAQRTSPTYPADGAVRQVPVVGSARTDASVEIVSTGGTLGNANNVMVFAHPALADGFSPLLTPVATTATSRTFVVPLSTLPRGGFLLLGPQNALAAAVTSVSVRASTFVGNPASGGTQVDTALVSSMPRADGVLPTYGVFNLPVVDVANNGFVQLELLAAGGDFNAGVVGSYFLIPLDDEASLTTLRAPTTATRVWLDSPSPERPYDQIWTGTAADRSDATTAATVTRWSVPSIRPNASGTASLIVYVNQGATWNLRYWPTWHGMAPE